jgi:nicotinic acid mononucleotide adenylyltransferase
MEKDEVTVNKTNKNKKETGTVKQQSVTLKAKGNSLTGKPLDSIELNPQLDSTRQVTEQSRGGVVLTFGRMNPPTVGHEKLVDKVKTVAQSKRATPLVYLSHSQDKKKNPLDYDDKIRFARAAFGRVVQHAPQKTLIDILKSLQTKFSEVTLVVGSDRVKEFETLLNKYNTKEYTFDKIDVVSAGERDPDAEGVSGMSASKMRDAVKAGDRAKFVSGLPRKLHAAGKQVFDLVQAGMQLHEELEQENLLGEVLDIKQRRQRALLMKRYAPRIRKARERAKRRLATDVKLKKRAMKQARQIVRARVAGKRGANYANLSPAEKIQVDLTVEKRKKVIGKIAKRILPKVKQAEFQRLRSFIQGKQMEPKHTGKVSVRSESIDELNAMFEQYAQTVDTTTVDDIIEEMMNLVLDKIITEKQIAALEKRSAKTGIDFDILEQVYVRGLIESMGDHKAAFNRVNAFCCGGKTAMSEDYDLYQYVEKTDLNDVFESNNTPHVRPHMDSTGKQAGWKASNKHGKPKDLVIHKDWIKEEAEMSLYDKIQAKRAEMRKNPEPEKEPPYKRKPALTTHDRDRRRLDREDDEAQAIIRKRLRKEEVQQTNENFMDGKGPGKPGDSARHGLKGKSAAELRKIRSSETASPRKKQLAHWLLNMHHNEETELEERGLWDNIHAKRKRIKAGSGERMRKPGSKGAPADQDFKNAQESFGESNNTPHVRPHMDSTGKQAGWKASNKHGKVKYFGMDFKKSAEKHAGVSEGLKDPEDNPCWKGYEPVGTKKVRGKTVPNCVPEEVDRQQEINLAFEELAAGSKARMGITATPRTKGDRKKIAYVSRPGSDKAEGGMNQHRQAITKIFGEEGNKQSDPRKRLMGTDDLVKAYKADTPGQSLDESFQIATTAGIGITLTAADLGIKAKGGFALHPSVTEDDTDENV